jgi:hypothetical protein
MNGFTPSYADYDFDAGDEYAAIEFILPLFEETNKVSAPTMSFDNYELGNRFDDLFLEFSGNGLSVNTTYGIGYCAGDGNIWFIDGPFGEGDKVIEKDEKYILSIMMQVTEGYGIGGITKDMFVLNGITPYTLALTWDYEFDCLCIMVDYELPVLHEEEAGWHYDTTHHWGECECGERINIEAHECTDDTGKCDMCGYEISAPIYIYNGFDLTMQGFELGKPVSGITVTPPNGAHYTVESVSVYNFTKFEYCDSTHVLAVGNVYRIGVKLKADYGYVLLISKSPIGAYDVTLNGYTAIDRSSTDPNQFEFYMHFSEATTPCPNGEITINGYELDAFADDITLTLPDGYTLIGNYEIGYVLLDGEGPAEEIDNSTGYWLITNISVNPAYDPMSFSNKNLTLFGLNADIFAYNPIKNCYTIAFYLPDAPSASDADVDKLEFTLDGFKIGTSTDDITFTPNGGTGYKVDSGMFIYNDGSYDIYIGEIEAGQKYYYMMSIAAKEGYTLTSLRRENVTLNGKTPEEFFYEDGEFLFLVFELDTTPGTTPEPGTNPGTDDPADDKDGLGAGAIVGIVIGSVAVAGIGGFAIFWFVIKKKSFAELIAIFKKK